MKCVVTGYNFVVPVPEDFQEVLQRYTVKGFRVIALAHKPLPARLTWAQAQRITRYAVRQ